MAKYGIRDLLLDDRRKIRGIDLAIECLSERDAIVNQLLGEAPTMVQDIIKSIAYETLDVAIETLETMRQDVIDNTVEMYHEAIKALP